jgi:hypothetical protein
LAACQQLAESKLPIGRVRRIARAKLGDATGMASHERVQLHILVLRSDVRTRTRTYIRLVSVYTLMH